MRRSGVYGLSVSRAAVVVTVGLVAISALAPGGAVPGSTTPRVQASTPPTLSWINWTAPASYPESADPPGYADNVRYRYATVSAGQLTVGGQTVYVRLTGEVVDPSLPEFNFSQANCPDTTSLCYGLPSGFGTPANSYWNQIFNVDNASFTSSNVPSLPPNGDRIGLIGSVTGGAQSQKLEFFSDSNFTTPTTVTNIVMNISSLGSSSFVGTWAFSNDFSILSDNLHVNLNKQRLASGGSPGLTRYLQGSEFMLRGEEGAGTIQFTGSFSEFTWRVEYPEAWASWNIGSTTADPPLMILYETQGGSAAAGGDASTTTGATLSALPASPTRAGYTFDGWFTASTGGTQVTTSAPHGQTNNFTLYAQWTPDTLNVTYDPQSGLGATGGDASTTTGTTMSALPSSPTRAGYTFDGWFTSPTGGTQITTTAPHGQTGDFTLYAQWTAAPLAIAYDTQGGNAIAAGTTTISATVPDPGTPTRAGYAFDGWFTASTGGTALTFPYTHGQTDNFTLYAQWTPNTLNVTYDEQGGTTAAGGASTTTTGTAISALPTTTRAGYTLDGWFTSPAGGTQVTTTAPHGQTNNFTLYAQWTTVAAVTSVPAPPPPSVTAPTVSTPDTSTPPVTAPPTSPAATTPASPAPDENGDLPEQDAGTGTVVEHGRLVEVNVFIENETDLVMQSQDFELRLSGECDDGCTIATTPEGREVITLEQNGLANVSGYGFQPGTPVYIWLFSEPRFLGELTVAEDGTFIGQVALIDIEVGLHTLQVNGTTFDGVGRSANLGVLVDTTATGTEFTPVALPATGIEPQITLAWIWGLLALGGALSAVARRRQSI